MLLTDTDTVETHDRHDHEAETYDAMAEWILATWEDDDYLIAPGPIPRMLPNRIWSRCTSVWIEV